MFVYDKKSFYGKGLLADNNSMQTIVMFSLIAFLILLIACINYMNISTARTSKRSKEIGVRNAVGASRRQLLIQFIGESFVHTILHLGTPHQQHIGYIKTAEFLQEHRTGVHPGTRIGLSH